jgi:hypothetical protein
MNNDAIISYLAEWIEQTKQGLRFSVSLPVSIVASRRSFVVLLDAADGREVPVYGVITKLDTQTDLSTNSPVSKTCFALTRPLSSSCAHAMLLSC